MPPSLPEREVKKEMSMLNELKALGADVDGALENLNGKQSLYERLVFKFLKMMREKDVPLDFDENDYSEIRAFDTPPLDRNCTHKEVYHREQCYRAKRKGKPIYAIGENS